MDRSARKRGSAGSNSPPALNNGNKRRSANMGDANIAYQSECGSENINPNYATGVAQKHPTTSSSGRTARSPLSEIMRNSPTTGGKPLFVNDINGATGVTHISANTSSSGFPIGGIEGSTKPSRTLKNLNSSGLTYQLPVSRILPSIETPQNHNITFQMPASKLFHNKAKQSTIHCDGFLKETIQTDTTPSQNMSNNVTLSGLTYQVPDSRNLPGIETPQNHNIPFQMPASKLFPNKATQSTVHGPTYKSPISRILQGSSTMQNTQIPFKMPASRISTKKINQSTVQSRVDKGLLESYNCDKGRHMSPSMLYKKESDIKSTCMEYGSSTHAPLRNAAEMNLPNENDIPVFVPELSELNVRYPDWISSHSDINWQTAPPEVRNLMDSFNTTEHILEGVNENIQEASLSHLKDSTEPTNIKKNNPESNIAGANESNIDEDDDDDDPLQSHRGEYLSDDDTESSVSETDLWRGYMDLGKPDKICQKCKARMWNGERNNKSVKRQEPTFSICCRDGRVQLPEDRPPPPFLADLLSRGEKSEYFMKNIRTYNSMFAFTSMGGKIDHKINNGKGPWCFKLNGQNYHLLGSLKPQEGNIPKFCQLCIYDTENEIENRMKAIPGSDHIDPDIVKGLLTMLDQNNKLVKQFRTARDRFKLDEQEEFQLVLLSSKSASGRPNHVAPSNEVAGLIVGDGEDTSKFKDIIVKTKQGYLKRIHETYVHYMQLQYPLLFPYGDDGFHLDIPLRPNPNARATKKIVDPEEQPAEQVGERKSRDKLSMKEFYAYKLMIRPDQAGCSPFLGIEKGQLEFLMTLS